MIYLGFDSIDRKRVAIKVKKRLRAANEARILQFLVGVSNIPTFYGCLAMADTNMLGIVIELITDGVNGELSYADCRNYVVPFNCHYYAFLFFHTV